MIKIMSFETEEIRKFEHYMSVSRHLMNPLAIWIVLLSKRVHFKASNFIYTLIVGSAYIVTNYMGAQTMGRPVYPPIDWQSMKSHIFLFVAFMLGVIGHIIALHVGPMALE